MKIGRGRGVVSGGAGMERGDRHSLEEGIY